MTRLSLVLAALAGFASAATAQTPNRPEALVVQAENLTARQADRSQAVLPGDVVQYRLAFTNTTSGPVRNVVFDNPVPEGLQYVPGSATAARSDVRAMFSIDGGRTYSAEPTVERVENGRRVIVPAPAEMYTHVRWTAQGSVIPGAQLTAEFRAQLTQTTPDRRPSGERIPN